LVQGETYPEASSQKLIFGPREFVVPLSPF
jgi:hypothetical protein